MRSPHLQAALASCRRYVAYCEKNAQLYRIVSVAQKAWCHALLGVHKYSTHTHTHATVSKLANTKYAYRLLLFRHTHRKKFKRSLTHLEYVIVLT
jgi:hypothetical protein